MRQFLAISGIIFVTALTTALLAQDQPSSAPAVIDAADKAAIEAAMGKDVLIEGEIATAEWSRTGRVMNIEFKDTEESRLLAVVFERRRTALDEAFGGDLSKALTGARVRLKGTLKPYGGRVPSMQGRPQIILEHSHQITILEPGPTTRP